MSIGQFRRFSHADKIKYAMKMAAQDEHKAVTDKAEIKKLASAYEKKIAEERQRLGL
jgi:hypothetical protein